MKLASKLIAVAAILAIAGLVGMPSARARQAPEFAGISQWINSPPLTMQGLRGKVVLIDFWTYSCINCLRTLPHVTHWYRKYKDNGLVIVGVSSPEFDFEKDAANVKRAVERFGITYPVALDNGLNTWNAWNNRFWPAEYLVDRDGTVVMHHYGEGHYLETENAIRKLLGLEPLDKDSLLEPDLSHIGSPEMYLGLARVHNMANALPLARLSRDYTAPKRLDLNQYALQGHWRLRDEYAETSGNDGEIRLHFRAAKVNMVASSDKPVTLAITVDGTPQPAVTVQESKLYTLFTGKPGEHVLTVKIPKDGLRAFTFTFG
ncbi:MAG TPA: thioredoxin family protein [Rhodanobacteraceae bacterium]|nr:thioredoxin family protein [Rhodanobacteraceae bacterium]